MINGGAGTDIARFAGSVRAYAQMSGIETVELVGPGGNFEFNAANVSGLTSLSASTFAAIGAVVTMGANQSLSLQSVTSGPQTAGTADVRLAAASSVTATTINVNGVGAKGAALGLEIEGSGIATANIATSGTASFVNLTDALTTGGTGVSLAVGTVNVTGASNLTLGVADSSASKVVVNASTFTGALSFDASVAEKYEITGGTGNDRANFGGAFDTGDKFIGGNGTDTLATSEATLNSTVAGKINASGAVSSVEVLEYTGVASYALDASLITVSGLTTYSTSGAINGTIGNATGAVAATVGIAVTGQSNAQTFLISGNVIGGAGFASSTANGGAAASGITFAPTVDNASNALNLTLNGVTVTGGAGGASTLTNGSGGAAGSAIVATGVETLNIVSTGATSTAANAVVGGTGGAKNGTGSVGAKGTALDVSANTTINVSGANEIDLGAINSGNTSVTLNAGSLTGKLTAGTGTAADTITGGSGVNVITLNGGVDTVSLAASVAKADTITVASGANTTGSLFAKISSFTNATTTGDKLDVANVGTNTTATIQADVAVGTATGVTNLSGSVAGGILTFGGSAAGTATLANKIAAATSSSFAGADNEVLAFEHSGNTYIFSQQGGAAANTYDAGTDIIVELTGVTGLTGLSLTASGASTLWVV